MGLSVQELDLVTERDTRLPVRMWAHVRCDGVSENAVVRDLSEAGFGVETSRDLPLGGAIAVTIGGARPIAATIVHKSNGRYGCRLDVPMDAQAFDALTASGPFASVRPADTFPEPEIRHYPGAVRIATIAGGAIVCWSALLIAGAALLG